MILFDSCSEGISLRIYIFPHTETGRLFRSHKNLSTVAGFICIDDNAQNLIGHPVEYYYEDSSDGMEIKHIHSRLKNELIIDADRIEAAEGDAYRYYPSENASSTRKAVFSKSPIISCRSFILSTHDSLSLSSKKSKRDASALIIIPRQS